MSDISKNERIVINDMIMTEFNRLLTVSGYVTFISTFGKPKELSSATLYGVDFASITTVTLELLGENDSVIGSFLAIPSTFEPSVYVDFPTIMVHKIRWVLRGTKIKNA